MNLDRVLTEELQQEFLEYLKEDPEFEAIESLNEEVLNEGRLLNKIRWKLALFSLRFLKENSLNDFLRAYYSDKDGKETEKSKEWVAKKKREKLKKIREIANEKMSQEEKEKVANSQQAKQLETKGFTNFIYAGISGASAGIAYNQKISAERLQKSTHGTETKTETKVEKNIQSADTVTHKTETLKGTATLSGAFVNGYNSPSTGEVNIYYDMQNQPYVRNVTVISGNNIQQHQKVYLNDLENKKPDVTYLIDTNDDRTLQFSVSSTPTIVGVSRESKVNTVNIPEKEVSRTETTTTTNTTFNLSVISTILSSLAILFFDVMWGSIIISGIQTIKGIRSLHKANVTRRDEIMSELLRNRDTRDLKECLEFLAGKVESQQTLIEMYITNNSDYYKFIDELRGRIYKK